MLQASPVDGFATLARHNQCSTCLDCVTIPKHPMSRTKILIVDDDPALCALYRLYLERTGLYDVSEVTRPAEAVATALTFRPDAILLDVFMPGLDGRELAR